MTGSATAFVPAGMNVAAVRPYSRSAGAVTPTGSAPVALPAQEGPAGGAGRDGATCDLTFTTTRALSGHMAVCTAADGTLAYASADDPATAATFIGITLGAAALGATVAVRFTGAIIEPSWSWKPGPVFVGLHGTLTQIDPTAGYALAVGVATAPDTLLIAPQPFVFIA